MTERGFSSRRGYRCGRSILLGLASAGLVAQAGVASAEIRVVVSSKPAHALVASVMGTTGTASVLVAGSASPHNYAMKPSDARAVNGAAVFVRIGEGLEPFTAKLVKSLPKSVRVVTLQDTPGLNTLERREGGAFEAHDHDHAAAGKKAVGPEDERDPHVWLEPANAIAMIDHIAAVLGEVEPASATAFKANAAAAKTRIAALADELERDLRPLAGRPFVVLHDAYQYFEARFGLTAVGSIAVSPEAAPSGKRLTAIRRKIMETGAQCLFAEPGMQPRMVAAVAEGTKVRTALLDPEGTQLPAGATLYEDLMRGLSLAIRTCLGSK
jgi:zinc transport system substrate-binding protein